ncbi:efflux RND transporter periplasmic adaptor subunit [bacterium]|nr:efflux RND transporter periplasmic adaptor subunit [bacterium]NIN91635.1 efflux RND transporter periplasmic adaptor subunit [bacterium]NIO17983.1 efflux RND transporter periplasmic adaptor subunit [bacterium]NIO72948.1 efflux RND transporter periplasmic adaptor subunit [bacterium]
MVYKWIKRNKLVFIVLVLAGAGILLAVTSKFGKPLFSTSKERLLSSIKREKKIKELRKKSDKESQLREEEVPVNVFRVARGTFQDTLSAMGTVKGGSEIELRFQVAGMVKSFDFREGDKVSKGEVIARLDQNDALLKLKQAQIELEEYEKLYSIGAIVKSKLEQARLAARLASSEFEKTYLRAARDGIIGDKNAEVGEFITPNVKIATLVNLENVVVELGIIEKEIDRVFLGQKVTVNVDTYPGIDFTGRVSNISPLIAGKSKTLTVKANLDNPGGLLLPGMFARIKISVFEKENALFIPSDSLDRSTGEFRVFVVGENNVAYAQPVEVAYLSSDYAQIAGGIEEDELVVVEKPEALADGKKVRIIEVKEYGEPEEEVSMIGEEGEE